MKAFNLIVSFIIVICSFATVYSECTDFEYTNSMSEIINEVGEDSNSNDPTAPKVSQITTIIDTGSPKEVLDAIEEAEASGDAGSAQVEFSNFNIVSSYEYMKSVNSDTIGWLNIPNIGSYPIMYSGDNSYYLNHSATGAYAENGAIFMNSYCNGSFDDVALIHGHHLRSGGMFGSLKKYKDTWFFNSNELIEVFDGTKLRYYRPFSAFYYEDGVEYISLAFDSQQERTDYINSLIERSIPKFTKEYNINTASDLLVLSTCDYEFDNCRLGVACYEVVSVDYDSGTGNAN